MNELINKDFDELVPEKDLEYLIWFDEQKARAKVISDRINHAGREFLEKNNLENYTKVLEDGTKIHMYVTKDYTKKQCDTKKMKEEGVYDLYTKDVKVKGSFKVQIDYGEET